MKKNCDCTVCTKWDESGLQAYIVKYCNVDMCFVAWGETKRSFDAARKSALKAARKLLGKGLCKEIAAFKEVMSNYNFVAFEDISMCKVYKI
jgi:hypothetical protein